jgi:hypothetical protein
MLLPFTTIRVFETRLTESAERTHHHFSHLLHQPIVWMVAIIIQESFERGCLAMAKKADFHFILLFPLLHPNFAFPTLLFCIVLTIGVAGEIFLN